MVTDKRLSNLNAALGEKFFFPKGFILISIHCTSLRNSNLLVLFEVFFANTSADKNRCLSNLTKFQLCAAKPWAVRIVVENLTGLFYYK